MAIAHFAEGSCTSMGKGRFRTFDAFQKTVEEARIRTASGGIVTLVSSCIIFWLIVLEAWDWRRIVVRNELVVDRSRGSPYNPFNTDNLGERLDIGMNITFPHMPCSSLFLVWLVMTDSAVFGCHGRKWGGPD